MKNVLLKFLVVFGYVVSFITLVACVLVAAFTLCTLGASATWVGAIIWLVLLSLSFAYLEVYDFYTKKGKEKPAEDNEATTQE